jgi:2-oxoglutarate ferredoxin oxidoreductase subunit gamma
MTADLLLCMSQEACDKFYTQVNDDGYIIVDSSTVSRLPSHRALSVPISQLAEQATGRRITASIAALGLIVGLTRIIPPDALEKAVRDRVPAGTEEINCKALEAGLAEAERLREEGEIPTHVAPLQTPLNGS